MTEENITPEVEVSVPAPEAIIEAPESPETVTPSAPAEIEAVEEETSIAQ